MFSQGKVYPHLPERLSLLATGPDGQLCSGAPAGTTSVCGRRTINTEKRQMSSLLLGGRNYSIPCRASSFAPG